MVLPKEQSSELFLGPCLERQSAAMRHQPAMVLQLALALERSRGASMDICRPKRHRKVPIRS